MKNEKKILHEGRHDLYTTFIQPFKDAAKVVGVETFKILNSVLTGFHILLFSWSEERVNEIMEKYDTRMASWDKKAKEAMERIDSSLNRNADFPVAFMMFAPTAWATKIVVSNIEDALKGKDEDADDTLGSKKKEKEKPKSDSPIKSIAALGLSAAAGAYFASNKNHDDIVAELMKLFFGKNLVESRISKRILKENEDQEKLSSSPTAKKFQEWFASDEAEEIKNNLKQAILLGIKQIDDEYKKLETIVLSLAKSDNVEVLENRIAEIEKLGIDLKDLKASIEKAKSEAANELGNPNSKIGSTYNLALKGASAIKQSGKEATPEQAKAVIIDPNKQKQEASNWIFKKIKNQLDALEKEQIPEIKKSFANKLMQPTKEGYPLVPDSNFLKKMGIDLQTFKEGDPELADIWEKTKNKYGIN